MPRVLSYSSLHEHTLDVNTEGPRPDLAQSEPAQTDAVPTLTVKELSKTPKEWTLALYPAHLALGTAGDQPYVILREQVMKTATLHERMRAFAVQQPVKLMFKLAREDVVRVADWIGKPVLAAYYLKQRYAWVLPIAILWMVSSLPLGGDPSNGVESIPFDPVGFTLGAALVIGWICAKYRPHPALFLLDSLWFLVMAGVLIQDVLQGRSKGWLILIALLSWMAITGFKHFIRFKTTRVS